MTEWTDDARAEQSKRMKAVWTPEKRAAHSEKMRAIQLEKSRLYKESLERASGPPPAPDAEIDWAVLATTGKPKLRLTAEMRRVWQEEFPDEMSEEQMVQTAALWLRECFDVGTEAFAISLTWGGEAWQFALDAHGVELNAD